MDTDIKYLAKKIRYQIKNGDLHGEAMYLENFIGFSEEATTRLPGRYMISWNVLDAIVFDTFEEFDEVMSKSREDYKSQMWFAQPISGAELFKLKLGG